MENIVPFAETNFRNKRTRFGIKLDDRRRHMYVVGKTGMGKTTLIQNMVIDDIRSGHGLAVIDPHGEFAENLLDFVPEERIQDIIYFNPADLDFPIAFNVIENVAPEYRHLITDGLVAIFQKLWAESWGPRLEYVLRNTILALLEVPDSTLLGIMRMLVDKAYRRWVIAQLKDPVVRAFWVEEFSKYPDRFATEAVAPIQNKVGQFLANPLIRNIVGQTRTAFDIRQAMDERKIFIVNLSKGRIGEGTSRLLGAMMITKFQLAAMSRIDTPEADRPDFYLYVDEFQNFATEAFAGILSEARKYRLNLILAHQYIAQLRSGESTVVRDAVFGNVGTMITFRVGGEDAEWLEKEFEPEFMMNDLVNLSKFNVYLKLMIDGVSSRAFSATTLAPYPAPEQSFREQVIQYSREHYGSDRLTIEKGIEEWAGPIESPEGSEALGVESKKTAKRDMWTTACSVCGRDVQVPFEPDGLRPVYCDEHHRQIQAGVIDPLPPRRAGQAPRPASASERAPGTGGPPNPLTGRHDRERDARRNDRRPPQEDTRPARSSVPVGGAAPPRDEGVVVRRGGSAPGLSLSSLPPREDLSPEEGKRRKPHREQRDRPEPDLSGLRDILEEVQTAQPEEDLDKRIEEESVEDILGR